MENIKFIVDSVGQSVRLQKVMFNLGYSWCGDRWCQYTEEKYIYGCDNGSMLHGNYSGTFINEYYSNFKLLDAETFIAQHTKLPVGREVSIEEAMEMFVEAGAEKVENGGVVFSTGDFFDNSSPRESIKWPVNASDILQEASDTLKNRAAERDHEENNERSMERCVESFNAMRGHELSVEDGWLFMVFLKMARSSNGAFREDDYVDMAAYCALAGEEASA